MKHLVFIVNPRSGVDRQKAIEAHVKATLDSTVYTYEIRYTEYAKHGTKLAAQAAANGVFAVVAVGGDGSVNDVAKGLIGTDTALAIVPKGSGNGMARTLRIPLSTQKALSVINAGKTMLMDVGYANDHAFLSNAGVGFDTVISAAFASSNRRGLKAYSWLVAKHLWSYQSLPWRISSNGQTFSQPAFMISVANGQQFGYNFRIAPDASWTDGQLDVVIVRRFPKILGGMLVLRALTGSITRSPFVQHFRTKEIVVSHPQLSMMQTDGDAYPVEKEVRFSVEAAALRVIVP